jgi:predicted secreted protein
MTFAGINWATELMVYIILWWVTLFAVLPFGTRPVADADEATGWRGAPEQPRIGRKFLWTTVVATILWLAFLAVQISGLVSFRSGWLALGA